jgi:Arc/MetJ-type ribon-helix-helix transcriptional regulator
MTTRKPEADCNSMDQKKKIVQFRAPEALSSVIDETASRNFQTRSEYIRRSILEKLKSDGVKFEELSTAQV